MDDFLRILHCSRRDKKNILAMLTALADERKVIRLCGGKWISVEHCSRITGSLSVCHSGSGFVTPVPLKGNCIPPDIFIPEGCLEEAWHGDTVEVAFLSRSLRHSRMSGTHPEGRIIRIVQRETTQLAVRVTGGSIWHLHRKDKKSSCCISGRPGIGDHQKHAACPRSPHRKGIYARPADSRFPFILDVDVSTLDSIPKEGDLLLVTPGEQLAPGLWTAAALAFIGSGTSIAAQEQITRLTHGIPLQFPPHVEAEAARLEISLPSPEITLNELVPAPKDCERVPSMCPSRADSTGQRADLRLLPFVTVDGSDARDFDDAICVEECNGNTFLWVAIADVSHYVRPRSALDREAYARGNSCYFPLSVTPMLPERLSGNLCSLLPGKDRAAIAVRMQCGTDGCITSAAFFPGLIRSRARLTYEDVQNLLDAVPSADLPDPIPDMLRKAAVLARAMITHRTHRGALDLDLPEAAFEFDEQKRVTGIIRKKRLFSHRLIEAFMLAANESAAKFLTAHKVPFPLRAHPAPDHDRLETLFRTLRLTDAAPCLPAHPDPSILHKLPERSAGTPQASLISRLILRSMLQARYIPGPAESTESGHFGLASEVYCHFTSPIRRYADLLVHRALKQVLSASGKKPVPDRQQLLTICEQCNARERMAQEAEREITRRLACILLKDDVGKIMNGVISGITEFGIFVEPESIPADGMIRLDALTDDWYTYDSERQELTGSRTGQRFRLGQAIRIQLVDVSTDRLELTFIPEKTGTSTVPVRCMSEKKYRSSPADRKKHAPARSRSKKRNLR